MDKFGKENIELGKISVRDISPLPCAKALPAGRDRQLRVQEWPDVQQPCSEVCLSIAGSPKGLIVTCVKLFLKLLFVLT